MISFKFLILTLLLPAFCHAQMAVPVKKEIVLDEKVGDLDNDGIEEKVMVISLQDTSATGIKRELRILKKKQWSWIPWVISQKAILPVKEGGAMGDPFEYIDIVEGVLYVRQSGGNSWKWGQTDTYKYKNGEFQLIKYSSSYGKACEYWADFRYNFQRHTIAYRKVFEKCSLEKSKAKVEQEHFKYNLKKKLTIENRYENYNTVICPKLKQEISF